MNRTGNIFVFLLLCLNFQVLFADQADDAERLLGDNKTVREGLRELKRLSSNRGMQQNEALGIKSLLMLGEYLRKEDPESLGPYLKSFSECNIKNLAYPRVDGFSEHIRYLASMKETLKASLLIRKAKESATGLSLVILIESEGDILCAEAKYKDGVESFENALKTGGEVFRKPKKAYSDSAVQMVPHAEDWPSVRRRIQAKLELAKRQYRIQLYGEDFVLYEEARILHGKEKYELADSKYSVLIKKCGKDNIYVEAASFYRIFCRPEGKNFKDRIALLNDFIKISPNGLYRGQAMIELGRIYLLNVRDAKLAANILSDATDWFQKQRQRSFAVPMTVPSKSKEISRPPKEHNKLIDGIIPVNIKIPPGKLINRVTVKWYLPQKEKEARYLACAAYIALFKWNEAENVLNRVLQIDGQLRDIQKQKITNEFFRMSLACQNKSLDFNEQELKRLSNSYRCVVSYAGVRYLLRDFNGYKVIWEGLLKEAEKSNDQELTAFCLIALGNSNQMLSEPVKGKRLLEKAVSNHSDSVVYPRACFYLANLYGRKAKNNFQYEKAIDLYKKVVKRAPKDSHMSNAALMALGGTYAMSGQFVEAEKVSEKVSGANEKVLLQQIDFLKNIKGKLK